jgi:hypothetical protein
MGGNSATIPPVVTPPPADVSFDAFISYHSGDADWVSKLKEALEAKGVRVWIDSEQIRPGNLFPGTLASAVGSVSCVVLVLSRGSLSSAWVEEEYSLALAHRRRIIAALIDDVEPPGFLAGRTWVDFRDEGEFAAGLDQLVYGITGRRVADSLVHPAGYRTTAAAGSADEAEVLKRLIERRRQDARRLWQARAASGVIGLLVGGAFLLVSADASILTRFAVSVLSPLILTLAAWGMTTTGLTHIGNKVEQFELLRDGLEACRSRSDPGCRRLRQHFWDMLARTAAEVSARPAS